MKTTTRIKVDMAPINQILKKLGVSPDGDVQMQVTKMICQRMTRYMPFRSGMLSGKKKIIGSPTEIDVATEYATYQYYGKVMVNAKTGKGPGLIPGIGYRYRKGTILKETDRKLDQKTGTKNDKAGALWDRRLMADEGAQMQEEIQEYVNQKAGRK